MSEIVQRYFVLSWGLFVLGAPFAAFWLIAARMIYIYCRLDAFAWGYPATHSRSPSLRAFALHLSDCWFIFGAEVSKRLQLALRLFTVFALIVSIIRTMCTHRAEEFSRAGALITLIGLLAGFVGILESQRAKRSWNRLSALLHTSEDTNAIDAAINQHVDNTQYATAYLALFVSILGTIMWAYGDQLLKCNWPNFYSDDIAVCKCVKYEKGTYQSVACETSK